VKYEFTLFVGGTGDAAQRASLDVEAMCEAFIEEPYELVVIDVNEDPEAPRREDIHVLPTLIRKRPTPQRRVLGDLGDPEALARALQLELAPISGRRRV